MTVRLAACHCGGLTARCTGEPVRVSVCHCLACKRRTGSAFSYNATFDRGQVEVAGPATTFTRTSDEGRWATYSFCPACGDTVVYEIEVRPGRVSIPVGAFADPDFPEPTASVYGHRRHGWVELRTSTPITEEA